MKNYQDFCNDISNTIFEIIDRNGSILKWKQSWQVDGTLTLPVGTSGIYRGGNLFNLLTAQVGKGYTKPVWVTFNQVNNLDGKVLKGAKSQIVYFWKILNKSEVVDGKTVEKTTPLFKTYRVFNIEQTSLGDESIIINDNVSLTEILDNHNIEISTFGNQPRFNLNDDVIIMPKQEYFNSNDDYHTTLLHEMIHWTGHTSRLNRFKAISYQSKEYAEEELVAEIGSVFLATHLGINGDLVNHASYVNSWKQNLSSADIMRAVNNAAKAFEYLIY